MNRRWLPVVAFWFLFAASLGFYERYPWLDTAWYFALLFLLLFLGGYSIVHVFRHRHETGNISYQGQPRWLARFFMDEDDDSSQRAEKR